MTNAAIEAKKRGERLAFKAGPGYEGKREFRPRQVDDPMAPARGHRKEGAHPKVTAVGNVRESPLEYLYVRGFLDEAQMAAGTRFRRLYEDATGGLGSSGDIKPPVDGDPPREQIPERRWRAGRERKSVRAHLGPTGFALLDRVCGEGMELKQAATMFSGGQEARLKYTRRRFRECLDDLAELWMLGTRR